MESLKNLKVLIVDDVSIMRKTLKDILVEHCKIDLINLVEANNGADAVFMYEQTRPDVVFLDITMPDMNGKEVIEKLKVIDPDPIIIMCSGSGDKMSVIECIRAGAKDYVRKPVTRERLLDALAKIEGEVIVKKELRANK